MSAPATLVIADVDLRMAIADATSAHLNSLAPDLHPLRWDREIEGGTYAPYLDARVGADVPDGAESVAVAESWAERLGLTEDDHAFSGQRVWEGAALERCGELLRVRLWCIADRDAWHAAVAAALR